MSRRCAGRRPDRSARIGAGPSSGPGAGAVPPAASSASDVACAHVRRAADEGRIAVWREPGAEAVLLVRPDRDAPGLAAMTWAALAEAMSTLGDAA